MIEKLKKLLQNDLVTFSVLYKIIQDEHEYLESDYENYIICYSKKPYPVWLWTRENISNEYLNEAISRLTSKFPIADGYNYNVRKEIANKIPKSVIKISMVSYNLKQLNDIEYAYGNPTKATVNDLELMTRYMSDFQNEVFQDSQRDLVKDEIRKIALNNILTRECYFWENLEGKKVALSMMSKDNNIAHINYVYTSPEHRKMGYAESLVHFLCKKAIKKNIVPTLYADETYIASNNCYIKLGFEKKV